MVAGIRNRSRSRARDRRSNRSSGSSSGILGMAVARKKHKYIFKGKTMRKKRLQ